MTAVTARLGRAFLTGSAALIPLAATLALLYWLATAAERVLGAALRLVLPEALYVPGLGIAAAAALILVVGILLDAWLFRKVWGLGEWLLARIPVVRTLYGRLRDFTDYFYRREPGTRPNQPVAVDLGNGMTVLGLVTREDLSGLPAPLGEEDRIAVYLPMSYQIGGYTVLLERDAVTPVALSMDEALSFILTGGITSPPGRRPPRT